MVVVAKTEYVLKKQGKIKKCGGKTAFPFVWYQF